MTQDLTAKKENILRMLLILTYFVISSKDDTKAVSILNNIYSVHI